MAEQPEDLTQHPAYALALKHMADRTIATPQAGVNATAAAADQAAGVAPIPAGPGTAAVMPAGTGGAVAALPRTATPSAGGTGAALVNANLTAKQPLVDESVRQSQRMSVADWSQRPGGTNDPWSNGTFKSIPRVASAAPVGGTSAVTDGSVGLNGNTRTPAVRAVNGAAAGTAAATNGVVAPAVAAVPTIADPLVTPRKRNQKAIVQPGFFTQR